VVGKVGLKIEEETRKIFISTAARQICFSSSEATKGRKHLTEVECEQFATTGASRGDFNGFDVLSGVVGK
jgi:hypothetical protein